MIHVSELIEGQLAVTLRGADDARLRPAFSRKTTQRFHAPMPGFVRIVRAHATSASELLNAGVEHAGEEAVFEALVEIAYRPQLRFDPTFLDAVLESLQL